MKWSSQSANSTGDSTIEIRSGGDCHSGIEGTGIEVMLSIEDEGNIEGLND